MLVARGEAHGGEDVAGDHAALEVDDGGLHLVAHAYQADDDLEAAGEAWVEEWFGTVVELVDDVFGVG